MFGLFRAGGFAAASLVLSASVMGVGHAQIVPLATSSPTITAPAPADFAPIFEESPQLVLPVQSAPITPTVQPTPEVEGQRLHLRKLGHIGSLGVASDVSKRRELGTARAWL